ncbi:hypothetical protein KUTeg_024848 [Tegillarca granosa]|uniref:C1q domain-containing protein n=1 Tax=Tegillarca granosa TaxID=220873 RepID=A0ABQ9E412_TEGGR|nr:hypothetical protein KUTeg_024848 [Tegillarca granosa]
MFTTDVLFSVVIEYTIFCLMMGQDIMDPNKVCESTKSSCSLYSRHQRRLTDLEAQFQEMMKKIDSKEAPQNIKEAQIAFTAKKKQNSKDVRGTIIFEDVLLNQGDRYSNTTGKFTAHVNGIYVFSWTIVTEQTYALGTELMLNGNRVAYGWTDARLSPVHAEMVYFEDIIAMIMPLFSRSGL